MPRILVAYCSKTGATRRAAQDLAGLLGADLKELGAVQGLPAYDLVIVGASVSSVAASITAHAFLARHRTELRAVAFLGTCGGRDTEAVLDTWADACGKKPLASAIVPLPEIEAGLVPPEVYRLAEDIRQSLALELGAASAHPHA